MKTSTAVGEKITFRTPQRYAVAGLGPGSDSIRINEPTVQGRLSQIRETLATMEMHAREFDGAIFGNHEQGNKGIEICSFDDQLADVGTRLACMCGFLATVNSRFGIVPLPGEPE